MVYARSLTAIPHLAHLSKLLQRLPPIDISEHWTPRMTRYIPLVRATQPADPTSTPIAYDRKAVIQDLVPYSFLHGRYDDIYTLTPRKNRSLWTALVQGHYEWNPSIKEQFDPVYTPKDREGPPWFTVKELSHWIIKHTSLQRIRGIPQHTSITVYMAKPRFLRQCWIQANPKKYMLPSTRIPMSPAPAIMMSNSQWKLFWRLPLPHKVRNCWWRLLIHKIPDRRSTRHAHQRSIDESVCQFCQAVIEDTPHMLFFCPRKRSFWQIARFTMQIDIPLSSIWDTLNFRSKTNKITMVKLAYILLVFWQMHWQCIFQEIPWNTTNALVRLRRLRWLTTPD
ncbi:hypothetical protein [Absidia glauca]|uniref:Reverse transcriptase zinc-binding domain-containing protein n=1 Tax=Absidia glauca TaxID=4829 RepID=A0A168R7T9_ABSGL|nr:hypothetical protein [Absidia glauca]